MIPTPKRRHPTFAVTGWGHSGTVWLATEFGRSPSWTVTHEWPCDPQLKSDAELFQPASQVPDKHRYQRYVDYRFALLSSLTPYGEVNGAIRTATQTPAIDRVAIVLRDPREVICTSANKAAHRVDRADRMASNVDHHFRLLDKLIDEQGVQWWRFEDLIADRDTVLSLARYVGIDDLDPDAIDMSPRNSSGRRHWPHHTDMPDQVQRTFGCFDWMLGKYYPEADR